MPKKVANEIPNYALLLLKHATIIHRHCYTVDNLVCNLWIGRATCILVIHIQLVVKYDYKGNIKHIKCPGINFYCYGNLILKSPRDSGSTRSMIPPNWFNSLKTPIWLIFNQNMIMI
mmetsp:Transcript_38502/g.89515  ORF Transcript_38502/g.89515 Transcript_38502/m.89515 type:complete len:117 (-) Transcript_38502:38-388(-)